MSCLFYLGYSAGAIAVALALLTLVAYRAAEWLLPRSAGGIGINILLGWFALIVAVALPGFGVMRFDAPGSIACGEPFDGLVLMSMYLLFPIYMVLLIFFYKKRKARLGS